MAFPQQVEEVCTTYLEAARRQAADGTHTVSTDEKTGIQALERVAPTKPMGPGREERREFEYTRRGTQCLIANLEGTTGRIVAPTVQATRTEADFVAHVAATVATDPQAPWVFVVDNLNIHQSEGLVRYVAKACSCTDELGGKGKRGVLKSMASRRAFLADKGHRLRFVYTPKHTSWLNQVEIWLSILVRRLLRRGSFPSTKALRERLLAFIDYFNRTLAKPFRWTYTGRPLNL